MRARKLKTLACCGRTTHVSTCRCCEMKKCPTSLFNGDFCDHCMVLYRKGVNLIDSSYQLRGARKCAIPGCPNTSCQGIFVGKFCAPCHNYITGKSCGSATNPSQAYRNELTKANFRVLAGMKPRDGVENALVRFEQKVLNRRFFVDSLYGKFGK